MNNTSYENHNNVLIKGKIVKLPSYSHTVMGEGFFEMYVEVKRLSDETDILPVTISERLIEGFNLGDEIGISGQFRSYNKLDGEKSKEGSFKFTVLNKAIKIIAPKQKQ